MTTELLRALLIEVRALRRAVERTPNVRPSTGFFALLQDVWALMGEGEWTCAGLIQHARSCDNIEARRLLTTLEELRIEGAYALGTFLRSRIGVAPNGFELRRLGLGANHVARWAVLATGRSAHQVH